MTASKTPVEATLTVTREKRLSDELLGLAIKVKVSDSSGLPVEGLAFQVHSDSDLLMKAATDSSGEYTGQCILNIRADTQRRLSLVIESTPLTAWVIVPKENADEKVGNPEIDYENFGKQLCALRPDEVGLYVSSYDESGFIDGNPEIDYENFGKQLCALRPDEVGLYVSNYDESRFINEFRCLIDPTLLGPNHIDQIRSEAKTQLRHLLNAKEPWSRAEISAVIEAWIRKLLSKELEERLEQKKELIIRNLQRIQITLSKAGTLEEILDIQTLDNLYEKIRSNQSRIDQLRNGSRFGTCYPLIWLIGEAGFVLNDAAKQRARHEIENLFGREVKDPVEMAALVGHMEVILETTKAEGQPDLYYGLQNLRIRISSMSDEYRKIYC